MQAVSHETIVLTQSSDTLGIDNTCKSMAPTRQTLLDCLVRVKNTVARHIIWIKRSHANLLASGRPTVTPKEEKMFI